MKLLKKQGEKIIPDFIEEDYISAIETALNRCYYYFDKNIEIRRISQADENELGYDGVLNTIVPFYIQFKRSDFYSPRFTGKIANQRKSVSLPTEKGFFAFELLKKDKEYGQHNALYKLSQNNKAAYVAPLFFKSTELKKLKFLSSALLPVQYREVYFHPLRGRDLIWRNKTIFKNSITIPPHEIISDRSVNHHYSFCKDYKVGFHSDPINLENSKSKNLYYFIQDVSEQLNYNNSENIIDKNFRLLSELLGLKDESEEYNFILTASINRISGLNLENNIKNIIKELSPIDKLLIIEDILYQYFNIRQFVMYNAW